METEARMRMWKAALAAGSLLVGVLGFGGIASREASHTAAVVQVERLRESGTEGELELEVLPPIPSVRRPVASTRSSR